MSSLAECAKLSPPPRTAKTKRNRKVSASKATKPSNRSTTEIDRAVESAPQSSFLGYDGDASTLTLDGTMNSLNSIDTTMLNLFDNPFRDDSLFQIQESAQSVPPLSEPSPVSNPSDPFIAPLPNDTSTVSAVRETFSELEAAGNDRVDEGDEGSGVVDVIQFLMEGQDAADDRNQNEANPATNSSADSTSDRAQDADEADHEELARNYVLRKVAKIDGKIKKYEAKLAVLREKRTAYRAQLDPEEAAPPDAPDAVDQNKTGDDGQPPDSRYSQIDAMEFMRSGSAMLKYGRFGYPHFRHFELSEDGRFLLWYSAAKKLKKSRIELSTVSALRKGQLTPIFRKHLQPRLASCSFSVIYGDGKSLDVITKNRSAFVLWTKGLAKILEHHQLRLPLPTELWVKIVKRNQQSIEERFAMQPQPQRKTVERELKATTERFNKLMAVGSDAKWDSLRAMEPVRRRLVELEQEMERIRHLFEAKTMSVASHEIWRTTVELKALKNKIQAITKEHKARA